jgi:hypothetical protein
VLAEHPAAEAVTAVVPAASLLPLADTAGVISIASDMTVRATQLDASPTGTADGLLSVVGDVILPGNGDTSGPAVLPSVLLATLGVANSPWTGRGVGVAVIDSGLETSSAFRGRVAAFYDFTGGGVRAASPFDDYGHGTHVAGIIGGSGALSKRNEYRGLAPNVKLVVLKVLDHRGAGYTSDVIRAIDFAVENRARYGIAIINLSLGHPIAQPAGADPLVLAVERASRAGIIVVVAAGNLGVNPTTGLPGYAGITSPGNAPSAVTVGAARTGDTVARGDDRIPKHSSAGPTWYDAFVKPDLLAPGHNIVAVGAKQSAIYQTYPSLRAPDPDYIRLSGTSMAAAAASGSLAQMLEANRSVNSGHPDLTPNAAKAILHYTAVGIHDDLGLEYNPLRKGAGALNAKGANEYAASIDTSAPVGATWLLTLPVPWTEIGGEQLPWSEGVVWGGAVIWGSTTSVHQTAWSNAVIWGSTTTWSSAVGAASSGPTRRRGAAPSSGAVTRSATVTARRSSGQHVGADGGVHRVEGRGRLGARGPVAPAQRPSALARSAAASAADRWPNRTPLAVRAAVI